MSEVEPPVVVGLGEVLWDCLPDGRLPGGAPANVAYHAAQLGCRGVICSRVGVDVLGDEYLAFATSRQLETAWIQCDRGHATGRADVQLDAHGQPKFVIQENVAWDFLEASQPAQSLMLQASAVCFGTLAQRSETARRSMHVLLAGSRSDCLLVYDVNLRQHWYQKDWIEDSLFLADIAKLNHDEALVLARVLELGVASPLEIANALQSRFDIRLVCITRGAQGCLLATDQGHVDLPGQLVKTVDSVGAGDAFTAALIYSHWQDWDLARRGQFANRIGGLVAARCGAMPDLAAEFSELQGEFGDRLS